MPETLKTLATLRKSGGCFPLPVRPHLRVTGADRLRYLNGQTSNDLRRIAQDSAQHALVLTAKGKLCAEIFLWQVDGAILIETPPELLPSLIERLDRYIVADDVQLQEITDETPTWHVFGPAAFGSDGLKISRLGVEGVDTGHAPGDCQLATPEEQELLRIERGVPHWGAELDENTLPQEAGLDADAVDFAKGCYVGQEVVSRLRSVGRVNRKLCGFIGDFPPGKHQLLTESGSPAGNLTSSAPHFELAKSVALGYVHTRFNDSRFLVTDDTGSRLGEAERHEFPLVP